MNVIGEISTDNHYKKNRLKEWKYRYRNYCSIILTVIATLLFFSVWYEFVVEHNTTGWLLGYGNLTMALMLYLMLYTSVGRGLRAFNIGVERSSNILVAQISTLLVTDMGDVIISMAITGEWRYWDEFLKRYLILWLIQSVIIGIMVMVMITVYRHLFPPLDIIEIYGKKNGLYGKFNELTNKYHISETVYASHIDFDTLVGKIKLHEAVLINDLPSKQKNKILKICFDMNKRVYVVPKISDVILKYSDELNLVDTPVFLCKNRELSPAQTFVKRAIDIVISFLALVILSPVLIITAICIKIEDGGAVFFRQKRCTINGTEFDMLKFRSMTESGDTRTPTSNNDKRITKTGKVIRAWRIDELPQMINILKGEMSIVGPRPERIEHVKEYTERIPEFKFRLKVKGGLTGYAQVYGRYNTGALDKLKLDLMYITNYSIMMDLQIIFETLKILFLKESTDGFDDPGILEAGDKSLNEEEDK